MNINYRYEPYKNRIESFIRDCYKTGEVEYDINSCQITYLFIEYGFREQKIGSKLLMKAEKELKENGCQQVKLISGRIDEDRPDGFYMKHGYKWQNPFLRWFFYKPYAMEKEL